MYRLPAAALAGSRLQLRNLSASRPVKTGLSIIYISSLCFVVSQIFKLIYFVVNVAMMIVSVYLQRQIFLLAGGLGSATYIVQLLFINGTLESNSYVSIAFGVILIGSAYYVDLRTFPTVILFGLIYLAVW